MLQVILRKRLNVVGSTLRNRSHEVGGYVVRPSDVTSTRELFIVIVIDVNVESQYKKELVSRFAKETLPHFSSKQLKPVVNQVFRTFYDVAI